MASQFFKLNVGKMNNTVLREQNGITRNRRKYLVLTPQMYVT